MDQSVGGFRILSCWQKEKKSLVYMIVIWNMREFYNSYADRLNLQPLVAEISWMQNLVIFSRCKDALEREFHLFPKSLHRRNHYRCPDQATETTKEVIAA